MLSIIFVGTNGLKIFWISGWNCVHHNGYLYWNTPTFAMYNVAKVIQIHDSISEVGSNDLDLFYFKYILVAQGNGTQNNEYQHNDYIAWQEIGFNKKNAWWRHQMETFSALLAICAGNSPVTGEFPAPRPVTRSFDDLFDLHLNKRLSKQS